MHQKLKIYAKKILKKVWYWNHEKVESTGPKNLQKKYVLYELHDILNSNC